MRAERIWQPSSERIAHSHLSRFMACVQARCGRRFTSYAELHAWSIAKPDEFWRELAAFSDTRARWGSEPVLQNPDAMPGRAGSRARSCLSPPT